MTDESMFSVVYRTGPLTAEDYAEAIAALEAARTQLQPDGRGCVVCHDNGHQAMECHHNPLVMARAAGRLSHEYRCFHCGHAFTGEAALHHFGPDERAETDCLPDQAKRLRRVLFAARDLMEHLSPDELDYVARAPLEELDAALNDAIGEV